MGTAFDSIARGLNEAIAHAKGKKVAVKTYKPEAGGCFRVASAHGHDARTICRAVWIFCCNIAPLGARGSYTARRFAGAAECDQARARCGKGGVELKYL